MKYDIGWITLWMARGEVTQLVELAEKADQEETAKEIRVAALRRALSLVELLQTTDRHGELLGTCYAIVARLARTLNFPMHARQFASLAGRVESLN